MATWWSTGAVAAAVAAVMVASGADRVAAQPAMGKETKPAAGMKDDTGMTPGGQGMEDDKKAMKDKKGT